MPKDPLMTKKFTRTIEDFTCDHCGAAVAGNGFTNHCPVCLTSKHVDVNPGDRAEDCGGLMTAIGLEQKGDTWVITHKCRACGKEMKCKSRAEDFDAIVKLARAIADPR